MRTKSQTHINAGFPMKHWQHALPLLPPPTSHRHWVPRVTLTARSPLLPFPPPPPPPTRQLFTQRHMQQPPCHMRPHSTSCMSFNHRHCYTGRKLVTKTVHDCCIKNHNQLLWTSSVRSGELGSSTLSISLAFLWSDLQPYHCITHVSKLQTGSNARLNLQPPVLNACQSISLCLLMH